MLKIGFLAFERFNVNALSKALVSALFKLFYFTILKATLSIISYYFKIHQISQLLFYHTTH